MKKILLTLLLLLIVAGLYFAWSVFGPTVNAPEGKYLYVRTGSDFESVKKQLVEQKIIAKTFFFDLVSKQVKYTAVVKPGRYEIKNGTSILSLVRMLKSGNQSPVKLVINKLRTKEDLAGKIGNNFEADSMEVINFLTNNDSLSAFGLDSNTVMTAIIPNTYLLQWNSSFKKLFSRFKGEEEKFWTDERKQKAAAKNLSRKEVYTIASIVDEETNKASDKGLITSVYVNRINRGMKLQADPTVKYAMRNFGLKRILHGHLDFPSPYNTYQNSGLPPGPISTALPSTIDSVLNAPETDYIFFVAKPDFKGYSNFASTYAQHQIFARQYQLALDSLIISKQNK